MIRIDCPFPKWQGAYVSLPDEWLGKHAAKYDEAIAKSEGLPVSLRNFAAALALLDDWQIPGVPSNLTAGVNFAELPLPLISWVTQAVFASYNACFVVPKALP